MGIVSEVSSHPQLGLSGIEVFVVPSTSTIDELSVPPCLLGLDEV